MFKGNLITISLSFSLQIYKGDSHNDSEQVSMMYS